MRWIRSLGFLLDVSILFDSLYPFIAHYHLSHPVFVALEARVIVGPDGVRCTTTIHMTSPHLLDGDADADDAS